MSILSQLSFDFVSVFGEIGCRLCQIDGCAGCIGGSWFFQVLDQFVQVPSQVFELVPVTLVFSLCSDLLIEFVDSPGGFVAFVKFVSEQIAQARWMFFERHISLDYLHYATFIAELNAASLVG